MSISIIIPNYNGEDLFKKNLPKVLEAAECYQNNSSSDMEIIIVDDASTDGSVEKIKDQISKIKNTNQKSKIIIRILQNNKNMGFSSTVNKGVREAEGEIVVLLNTDISPEKNFLVSLVRHFKNPEVFAVGCMDKSIEGENIVLRGRGIGEWKRGFLVHKRGEVDRTDTLWASGGSSAFRKSIWNKLGGLNELYNPFYWEDIDLSYRALKSGYQILFDPESVVIHEHSKGSINAKYSRSQVKTIAYRNQLIFVWLNINDSKYLIEHFIWLPYYLLTSFKNRNFVLFLGFLKACLLIPKILKHRTKQKTFFIKTDRVLLNQFSYEYNTKN